MITSGAFADEIGWWRKSFRICVRTLFLLIFLFFFCVGCCFVEIKKKKIVTYILNLLFRCIPLFWVFFKVLWSFLPFYWIYYWKKLENSQFSCSFHRTFVEFIHLVRKNLFWSGRLISDFTFVYSLQ